MYKYVIGGMRILERIRWDMTQKWLGNTALIDTFRPVANNGPFLILIKCISAPSCGILAYTIPDKKLFN